MTRAELEADAGLAREAARRAGAVVRRYFGTALVVQHKEPGQPLTIADLEADSLLKELLGSARPEYGWLSEETEDRPDRLQRSRVWIVDPIDGTRSFVAGRPEFAISVGLAVGGEAVVGVVYNPVRDELFCGTRGGGAFVELETGREPLVLPDDRRDDVRVLASRSEIAEGEIGRIAEGWTVEGVGSTAYKLARVAWSRGDAFVSPGVKKEWDVCAGALILSEAGGRTTDANGAALEFNRADPIVRGVAAAHASLHQELVKRIAAAASGGG